MRRLYLDHNATSPLRPRVRDALRSLLDANEPANPGSVHAEGQRARALVEQARRAVLAQLPGADGTLTFTSGATESNNLVMRSYAERGPLVLSRLDHPSVVATGEVLEQQNYEIRWVANDEQGRLDVEHLASLLDGAALFSIAEGNNELGLWRDVPSLGALCRGHDVALHVDAAQTFGRFRVVGYAHASAVTLSAHKAGGPTGTGALYQRHGAPTVPLATGGHQERGRRPGTENLLGIVGWGALVRGLETTAWESLAPLRDTLEEHLVSSHGALVNAGEGRRLPNTTNLSLPGVASEELVMAMDLEGVAISAGSACTAGSIDLSPVLLALGLPKQRAGTSVRLSLGPEWTKSSIDDVLARFDRVLARLRR